MRHVLFGVLVAFILTCFIAWAALPFTDAFTASDGTALATYNANWTVTAQSAGIYGNAVGCTSGASSCMAKDNSNTYSGNQIAEGTILTPAANYYAGVGINIGTGDTGYGCRGDDNEFTFHRRGPTTLLWQAPSPTVQNGDVVRSWRDGNNVYCQLWRSGVLTYNSGAINDTTYTTGSPGFHGFGNTFNSATTRLDDITLNDYTAGGATPIRRRPIMMFFTLPELP